MPWWVVALLLVAGCATPTTGRMVAVPSMTGTLPDGSPVYAIVIVPEENVGEKNEAWLEFEDAWPTRYRFLSRKDIP